MTSTRAKCLAWITGAALGLFSTSGVAQLPGDFDGYSGRLEIRLSSGESYGGIMLAQDIEIWDWAGLPWPRRDFTLAKSKPRLVISRSPRFDWGAGEPDDSPLVRLAAQFSQWSRPSEANLLIYDNVALEAEIAMPQRVDVPAGGVAYEVSVCPRGQFERDACVSLAYLTVDPESLDLDWYGRTELGDAVRIRTTPERPMILFRCLTPSGQDEQLSIPGTFRHAPNPRI